MFRRLSTILAEKTETTAALPPCRHRLIICDSAFPLHQRPELLVGRQDATLMRWGDLAGDFRGFMLDGSEALSLQHAGSRIGAYSSSAHNLHRRSFDLARRFSVALDVPTEPRAGGVAPLLYLADELFKFMQKAEALRRTAADPTFDQIVLVQDRSLNSLEILQRLAPNLAKRIWLTWSPSASTVVGEADSALKDLLQRGPTGPSSFMQHLQNAARTSCSTSALPWAWVEDAAGSQPEESASGKDALLCVVPGARSVADLWPRTVSSLCRRWPVEIARIGVHPAQNTLDVRTHDFVRPDEETAARYRERTAAIIDAKARELLSLYPRAFGSLETVALDTLLPGLIKRGLPHFLSQAARFSRLIQGGRFAGLVAFGGRVPLVVAALEAAHAAKTPSVMLELNAVTSLYPRYIRPRADMVLVSSGFVAKDYVRHFGLAASEVRVVGTPDLDLANVSRAVSAPARVSFAAQPLSDDQLWNAWRMVVLGVARMDGDIELSFRRHPLQDPAVGEIARRIAVEGGVRFRLSDPAMPLAAELSTTRAVVTCFSTVAAQAAWNGVPTLIAAPGGASYPIAFDRMLGLSKLTSARSTRMILSSILAEEGAGWRRWCQARQRSKDVLWPLEPGLVEEAVATVVTLQTRRRLGGPLFVERKARPHAS